MEEVGVSIMAQALMPLIFCNRAEINGGAFPRVVGHRFLCLIAELFPPLC